MRCDGDDEDDVDRWNVVGMARIENIITDAGGGGDVCRQNENGKN